MAAKEDFISLFAGLEEELSGLPKRWTIHGFNYMITSQRTLDRIHKKLNEINEDNLPASAHGNYWSDLEAMGLADAEDKQITQLGRAALAFFDDEEDDIRREHFILSAIRQRAFPIPADVFQGYNERIRNLERLLAKVPSPETNVPRLFADAKKLTFLECLNRFEGVVERYFALSRDRQEALDRLGEHGLKDLFEEKKLAELPYARVAHRIKNVWREFSRRENFVKHYFLAELEHGAGASGHPVSALSTGKLAALSGDTLISLATGSSKLRVGQIGAAKVIRRQPTRRPRALVIMNSEDLLRRDLIKSVKKYLAEVKDPLDYERAREVLDERTKEHQQMLKKLIDTLYANLPMGSCKQHPQTFDLLVDLSTLVLLHEAKTTRQKDHSDERKQIVKGVGQLLYYAWFNVPSELTDEGATVVKIMLLQHKPIDSANVDFLTSLGIETIWFESDGSLGGRPESLGLIRDGLEAFRVRRQD